MKFTTAWASVHSQNITLKIVTIMLSTLVALFGIATLSLSLREPLVVERSCYTRALPTVDPKRSEKEIEAFLLEAVPARFNSDAVNAKALISGSELAFREKEQADLLKKGMRQRVIVNPLIRFNGSTIIVDCDRVISIGKLRSALPFPLTLEIVSTTRTNDNPYGLIIQSASEATPQGDAK